MDRGSTKHGPALEEEMKKEAAPTERVKGSGHAEEWLEKEDVEPGSGHRIAGTGSSAGSHGDTGGRSHPKPKDAERDQD